MGVAPKGLWNVTPFYMPTRAPAARPSRHLEAIRCILRAGSIGAFSGALQYFDIGSQNFAYADNIAYFTSAGDPGAPAWQIEPMACRFRQIAALKGFNTSSLACQVYNPFRVGVRAGALPRVA